MSMRIGRPTASALIARSAVRDLGIFSVHLLALALVTVAPVAVEAQQDLAELVRQGDTYLKRGLIRRNNLRSYTGDVIGYVPGRCSRSDRQDDGGYRDWVTEPKSQVRTRGSLRNGKWHGLYENYSGSSVTARGSYNMGQRCGIWTLESGRQLR
jgi:hypothetical protein